MDMKIVGITVAILVSITVLAGVLMPVLDDATSTEKTYKNEGAFVMTDDPTDYTLEYRGADGELLVRGELVTTFADLPDSTWTLISTPEYLVRMQGSSSNYTCWLTSLAGTNTYIGANTTESVTITVTDSTIQVGSSTPVSYTGEFRGIDKDGDYVMTESGGFVVSDNDTIIIGNGTTGVTHWYDAFYIIGTVDDIHVYSSDSITVSNVAVNSTAIPDYNGSTVNSITFTATDGTNTTDATYNRVIVPIDVTLEKTVHFTDNLNELLMVIPVLIIVAILLGVIALVIRSRLD